MTDRSNHHPESSSSDQKSPDPIDQLAKAGPPPEIRADHLAQIKDAAKRQWQARQEVDTQTSEHDDVPVVHPHRPDSTWSERLPVLAIAATLLATVGGALWLAQSGDIRVPTSLPSLTSSTSAAVVERLIGSLEVGTEAGPGILEAIPGTVIAPGTTIETGADSRAALELATGASLRLATETRLTVIDSRVIDLERGSLYFDSRSSNGSESMVEVRAATAVVRDVGTQFEVRRTDKTISVRVREGSAQLSTTDRETTAAAGEGLILSADGDLEKQAIPIYGESWQWILESAPSYRLEDSTVAAYLSWLQRETGWRVDTSSPGVSEKLTEVLCCGSTTGPANQTLEVLETAGLSGELEGGVLRITPRSQ